MYKKLVGICVVAAVVFGVSGAVQAGPSFYSGKTLTIVVPYGPGGGYDDWARIAGPFMKKYLGAAAANVVIKNRPGGGGLIGTNAIYHAKPNGLTIGDTSSARDVSAQLTKAPGVDFDVTRYLWVGRADDDPPIIATHPNGPYQSFDDLVALKGGDKAIRVLATGKGSSDYNSAVITKNAFRIPFRMVAAFSGGHAENAAFTAGEGDTISVSVSYIA